MIVGASIGQFGGNSTQVFFVTWFPTYLVNVRGMDFLNAGLVLSDDVLATTAEHFAEMDPCQQFKDAHVVSDPGGPGVPARVIAGASHGVAGAMQRDGTAALYLDLHLAARATYWRSKLTQQG